MQKLDYDAQESWSLEAGLMQSPIALSEQSALHLQHQEPLSLQYDFSAKYSRDTGQSIEVGLTGQAIIDHRKFILQQFHVHAPSEHTLDGETFAGEIHFVHEGVDGRVAVVGVWLTLGPASKTFDALLNQLNQNEHFVCDVADLMPDNPSYFHYIGSLTTPPLTENVEWYMFKEPVTVSAAQLAKFHDHYDHNNRHLQPLNGRPVLFSQV